jgi:hypothetical protein
MATPAAYWQLLLLIPVRNCVLFTLERVKMVAFFSLKLKKISLPFDKTRVLGGPRSYGGEAGGVRLCKIRARIGRGHHLLKYPGDL